GRREKAGMSMGGNMARRLTTTSYTLLAQLSLRPWSTYELAGQRVRYFRYVWPRAESAIYREIKHLAADGLVCGRREHTGQRGRTVYTITDEGLAALREWLGTPVSPFAVEFEGMIRLFAAASGTNAQLGESLEQVRDDADEMLTFAGQVKLEYLEGRGAIQDQLYIRAHAIDFFVSLLNTVRDWSERTLSEVAEWDNRPIAERNERAMAILSEVAVQAALTSTAQTPVAPTSQTSRRR
ncbi:MAG: PadR family transcriptional regulator, partial [Acidimicrobiia bacterium]|nr:PadR family transcriptional regulator [Acidimicrobiia bacterium]